MAGLIERTAKRAAYGAAATARVGWYGAHYAAGRRIVGPMTAPGDVPPPLKQGAPSMAELQSSFRQLFADEARDIANGIYKMPRDLRRPPNPLRALDQSRAYFREARAVAHRAHAKGGGTQVRERAGRGLKGLPGYYHQNFHFQSDGWLSDGSARVYDTQVETLFTGAADAMRRRALPFIRTEIERLEAKGRSREETVFADIACGTGRLLGEVADNFAAMPRYAVDLSQHYLNAARRNAGADGTVYALAPAERLPFANRSVDILTSVYLFHELPPKTREAVAAEFARVLRPGGLYLHVDSIQYADSGMGALLESFPRVFHEPYYDSYAREDLSKLFGDAGLAVVEERSGFLTKVSAVRKPG